MKFFSALVFELWKKCAAASSGTLDVDTVGFTNDRLCNRVGVFRLSKIDLILSMVNCTSPTFLEALRCLRCLKVIYILAVSFTAFCVGNVSH